MRLISRRRVVLPLPLRPRSTKVSPGKTCRETSHTSFRNGELWAREGVPAILYVTSRTSMVGSTGAAGFVFISIDSPLSERDHHTGMTLPLRRFLAHPSRGNGIQRKGKILWEQLPAPFASGT